MATFEVSGFDGLNAALRRISYVPADIKDDALDGMAEVALDKIRAEGASMGVRDPESGTHILDKLSKNRKAKITDAGGYKLITFSGSRRRGRKKTETRNAEIAFVNEYGKTGQPARPFILTALNKNEEQIVAPGAKVIGDWIENEWMK